MTPILTTLATFNHGTGNTLVGRLTIDAAGDLIGFTAYGGANGDGTVFEIANTATGYAGTPTALLSFTATDAGYPVGALVTDAAGDLFGVTENGGAFGDGTVFEITRTASGYSATTTTLAVFNGTDGRTPTDPLAIDAAGDLFGVTSGGTVFEVANTVQGYANAPSDLATVNNANGFLGTPDLGLVIDAAGDLFGITTGGDYSDGGLFEIPRTASGYSTTSTGLDSFTGFQSALPLDIVSIRPVTC